MLRYASIIFLLGLMVSPGEASVAPLTVYSLPLNCAELLPDSSNFTGFFEAVARNYALSDRKFSRRLFRILAIRERISNDPTLLQEHNPIDVLIRKTLCFYREQREPLKAVLVDDEKFIQYFKASITELEHKVEDAVFNIQLEREQRLNYERKVKGSEGIIDSLKGEAEREAARELERLSKVARKKVRQP